MPGYSKGEQKKRSKVKGKQEIATTNGKRH